MLILELPRYHLGPKSINKALLISHRGLTGQKNKLQGDHRKLKKNKRITNMKVIGAVLYLLKKLNS